MIPSSLFAFVAILSSFAAANGAIVQRDGTFTYLTPQQAVSTTTPTSTPSSSPTSSRPTTTSSSTTSSSTTSFSTTSFSAPGSSIPVTPSSVPLSSGVTVTVSSNPTLPTQSGTPTGTGTPAPAGAGTANCNGLQQWQASFAYNAGDRVIYNGQLYTAKQWTYNNAPPTHPDQWTFGGTCTQPVNNQANCNGVSAWQSTVAYTAGNRVTYSGHLWTAVQWTQANTPGDTSGSWKDQGACA